MTEKLFTGTLNHNQNKKTKNKIVVVIPWHNPGNNQVSVNRTIGPTLFVFFIISALKRLWVHVLVITVVSVRRF